MAKAFVVSVCAALFFAQHGYASSPWHGVQASTLARTCNYFENRARFLPRGQDMSLEATLADSCGRALDRFLGRVGTTPYEAKRARRYLERLTDYKHVVIEMNTSGFKQAQSTQPTRLGGHPRIKVSSTGEYLIARQMGVISALKDWAIRARFDIALR